MAWVKDGCKFFVCLAHVAQIKKALGISGVLSDICSWRSTDKTKKGAQVDLIIDRNDKVINLCEMKYAAALYLIDAECDINLRNKASVFKRETKTKKAVRITLVTTYGLSNSKYNSVAQSEVTMQELFES
jgi:hypothetical protein